jgi:hypothetical protein
MELQLKNMGLLDNSLAHGCLHGSRMFLTSIAVLVFVAAARAAILYDSLFYLFYV